MGDAVAAVRLIVGLGNPGPRYARTRHNAGFWFADTVAQRFGGVFRAVQRFHCETSRLCIGGIECHLLKPTTYMNHSGLAIGQYVHYYRLAPQSILIAHDEIDLPPGTMRLKQGGGHGGHNGLRDTVNVLGTRDFNRLRIGVGHPGHRDDVVGYVLSPPTLEELGAIESGIEAACDLLQLLVEGEWERAFQHLHTAPRMPRTP